MSNPTSHPCPNCKEPAPRYLRAEGFSFGFTGPSVGATANTGVHKEDYPTADHAVGKDAESRWGVVQAREKVKEGARKQGGSPALIRHTASGHIDYEPMSDGGRVARRNLAKKAIDTFRAAAESKRSR
jgi:hypothetical protein